MDFFLLTDFVLVSIRLFSRMHFLWILLFENSWLMICWLKWSSFLLCFWIWTIRIFVVINVDLLVSLWFFHILMAAFFRVLNHFRRWRNLSEIVSLIRSIILLIFKIFSLIARILWIELSFLLARYIRLVEVSLGHFASCSAKVIIFFRLPFTWLNELAMPLLILFQADVFKFTCVFLSDMLKKPGR